MSYAHSLGILWMLILGIVLVPGMDMTLTLSQSLLRGTRAGLAVVLGVMAAGALHTVWGVAAAVFLLSLPASIVAVLLVAGALYLGWIGWTLLRSRITLDTDAPRALGQAFRQGALTNLMNPKAYAFVAAVYPQFVRPEFGPVWRQGLIIGLMVAASQAVVYGTVALAAGRARRWLNASPGATMLIGRISGGVMLAVAAGMIVTALSQA